MTVDEPSEFGLRVSPTARSAGMREEGWAHATAWGTVLNAVPKPLSARKMRLWIVALCRHAKTDGTEPEEIHCLDLIERFVDGLTALRRAAPARQHARAFRARERDRPLGLGDRPRQHHADRHDLIMRSIGRVAAAAETVEQHAAGDLRTQPALEPGHELGGHREAPDRAMRRGACWQNAGLTEGRIRP